MNNQDRFPVDLCSECGWVQQADGYSTSCPCCDRPCERVEVEVVATSWRSGMQELWGGIR